jgi:hypothetical protein
VQRIASLLFVLALVAAGCGEPVVSTVPTGGPPTPRIDAGAWGAAICQAVDQVSLGVGEPRTGEQAPAWVAFELALSGGSDEEIGAAGNAVLGHVTEAERSAGRATAFPEGAVAASGLRGALGGLSEGVRALRQAAIDADPAALTAARAVVDEAWRTGLPAALAAVGAVPVAPDVLPCRVELSP